jgi:hypothetical protein
VSTFADVKTGSLVKPLLMQLLAKLRTQKIEMRAARLRDFSPVGQLLAGWREESRPDHPQSIRLVGIPMHVSTVTLHRRVLTAAFFER